MQLLEPVTEDEMIAAFLKAEIDSTKFRDGVVSWLAASRWPEALIRYPNTSHLAENRARRAILGGFRGYPDRVLFKGFPTDIVWHRFRLDQGDIGLVRYCAYPDWLRLSGGTRSVSDGAQAVRDGSLTVDARLCREIADRLRKGRAVGELILVGETGDGPFVALEGHKRLTALILCPEAVGDGVAAIIGLSPLISTWDYF